MADPSGLANEIYKPLLLAAYPAGWGFYFDRREHGYLLADHFRRDRDLEESDEIG